MNSFLPLKFFSPAGVGGCTELSASPPSQESLRRLQWCTGVSASARQSRAQCWCPCKILSSNSLIKRKGRTTRYTSLGPLQRPRRHSDASLVQPKAPPQRRYNVVCPQQPHLTPEWGLLRPHRHLCRRGGLTRNMRRMRSERAAHSSIVLVSAESTSSSLASLHVL